MKVSFNKNCSKNYMYIEEFENYEYSSDYQIHMLCNNTLKHTLDFSYDISDNLPVFKYDITSKQSLSSLFSSKQINYKSFTTIMFTLMEVVNILEAHLIHINSIVLKPEYIYMDPEKYTTFFAICPGWQQDFYDALNDFISIILKKIDHNDDALVLLAYRISCDIAKPGYNLSSLKKSFLDSHNNFEEEEISSSITNGSTDSDNKSTPIEIHNQEDYSVNKSYSHELSDNSLKMLIKSRLFHNNSDYKHALYTISKGFYGKIIILSIIILLLFGASALTYITKTTSHHTSLVLLVIGIAFLFGSIRYLMEVYPSSKMPILNRKITTSQNTSETNSNISNSIKSDSLYIAEPSNDMLPPPEYGMTMLLSEVTTDKSHRLVYMGNDYTDDVIAT
jgi:hypothetical protein